MLYSDIDRMCQYRGKATTVKQVANMKATTLVRNDNGSISVVYHDTKVLTFLGNLVEVRTGGWFTQTTARRIEYFLNGESLDGAEMAIHVRVGGNPWRITTRRRNPAYTSWDSPEPVWQVLDSQPYTEGAWIHLVTGEITHGTMVDFAAHNKTMDKAIKAFVKGITPEAFGDGYTVKALQGEGLESCVRQKRYSAQLFQRALSARGFDNVDSIMRCYFWPLVDGTARWPESDAAWLRREIISYLRAELLIGPVPIRKNYGHPRCIA